jgi:hypothetical protein
MWSYPHCKYSSCAALAVVLLANATALPAQEAAQEAAQESIQDSIQDSKQSAGDSVSPISAALCGDMKSRKVLNPGAPAGCERLRLLRFGYVGFDGATHGDGELVVLDAVAGHVLQIFVTLRRRQFPIASARLMNRYDGDDDASMARNNTSAFNVRRVAGSTSISLHAYGVAIDLNPVQNPYIGRPASGTSVSPPAGADYVRRQNRRPGMAEAVVDVFADHGLVQWGGYWNNPIDYQHFQVDRQLARQLVRLPASSAEVTFERHVERTRTCIAAARKKGERAARSCTRASR